MADQVEFSGLGVELPDISRLSNTQLLLLRDQINILTKTLLDINMEEELVEQLIRVKGALSDVFDNSEESSNQKAALINSGTAIMRDLIKMQESVHNAERLKNIERTLIDTLKEYSEEISREFLDLYDKRLSEKSY